MRFGEDLRLDLDDEIRADAHDVAVVGGVVDLAQS
jgi:hypothetical protein